MARCVKMYFQFEREATSIHKAQINGTGGGEGVQTSIFNI
jgi:hypothetical protein